MTTYTEEHLAIADEEKTYAFTAPSTQPPPSMTQNLVYVLGDL